MATKLYLRGIINATGGLPTSEQSSLVPDDVAEVQTTNRTLKTVKGAGQIGLALISQATSGTREYYFTRFVSDALNMSSISANTWTYGFATKTTDGNANFPVTSGNKPVRVNCYVWRPNTSSKVGTILDGNTASTVDESISTTELGHIVSFSGSSVSGMQAGDVIIFEVWFIITQQSANSYTNTFYYDGVTELAENQTVSSAASYINTPQTLLFSTTTPVQNDCIQKYDIKNNVSQTSIHKYGLSVARVDSIQRYNIQPKFEGFTFFYRLFIPFLRNEVIYNKRAVLFSKLDDEQVTFGYVAQVSDAGDIHFIVRRNSKEYTLTALDAIDIPTTGLPDFLPKDFNSVDYFTIASTGVLPDPIPYDDLAFTYKILTNRMQIIKNGTIIADTNDNPEATGLVGHWRLIEGGDIGDDPDDPQTFTKTVFNSVDNANNGIITNATWETIPDRPHETYLSFNGVDSRIEINNYTEIAGPSTVTVSLWYYHRSLPNATNYIIRKNPPGAANNWTIYSDGSFCRVRLRNQDNTIYDATISNAFPDTNTWYHIVGNWTMGSAVNIFVNNVKSVGDTTAGTISGTGTLRIGNFTDNTVDGLIHDVKIWNRELSDAEVTTLFNSDHSHAGFPKWEANPPPPPEIPEPITNPFTEIYNLEKPTSNFTWQKLHKLVVSGFSEIYSVEDGTTIPSQNIPFNTIYNFTNIGGSGGGGGGGTPTTVYNVSTGSSGQHLEFEGGISRAGIRFNSGNSHLNKVITRVVVQFRKDGSPGGTASVVVRSSSGSHKTTLGTFNPGSFGSGEQFATINVSNPYQLVANDVVSVEYPSGSNTIELTEIDPSGANDVSGFTSVVSTGGSFSNNSRLICMLIDAATAGGGGDPGEVQFRGNDSSAGNGMYAASGGVLVGSTITRATFKLKRTGSPGGTVFVSVYNSPNSLTVLGSMSANSVSTIPTDYTFTNINNTRVLSANDWVGVTVSAANSTNYISSYVGPGAVNGSIEVRLNDTSPGVGQNYQWQTHSANDCAGKLEIGGTTTPQKLHYYNLDGGAVRAVGQAIGISFTFLGKKITRVKPRLKAVGNPTGTIFCRIRNSSGSLVSTCGSVEADTVSPIDFESKEFTNLLQNRNLASGDKIMIEYTGTATDYIQVMIRHGGGGPDNIQTRSSGGAYTEINADLSGQIFTGGTASDPDSRERVGEKADSPASILNLKKLSKALIWLRKVGAPPNNVTMRIRRQSDDNTVAVVGEIPTSSITTDTDGDQYEFTNSPVSIYAIQTDDTVLVEYADGDDDNYVEVMITTTDQIDSTNSLLVLYDALFTDYDVKTNQDLIMTAHEGGDTFTPTGDEIPPPPQPAYSHDLHIFAGGYPYDFYTDQENTKTENWMSAIATDIRFYRKLLTTAELTNIFENRRDRSGLPKGQVAVIGFFSLPP